MKKRLISILLTVLMVMSLFTGLSVSAYADNTVSPSLYTEYKLVEGDWVAKVCQNKIGVNYYDVREAIMLLNGITSEAQFSKLAVGKVIKIPVSSAAAAQVVSTLKNVSSTTTGTTGSGDVIVGVSGTTGTDPIAYYLIAHTMQAGETVLGICNSLGISFTDNQNLIKTLNNISDWTRIPRGKTILIPSVKTPSVGTSCYAVLAHKIVSGETTYSICQQNGISYNANMQLMSALNPSTNLTNIKAGAMLYVPVPTVIQAMSSGSSSGNKDNTTTTTPTPTPSSATEYMLTTSVKSNQGSVKFTVDGKSVTSAKQNDKVTVEVTPASGKAVNGITVKFTDGTADLKMSGNTFVMPACAVRLDATIQSGNNITIKSNEPAKTATTVNNIKVSSAVKKSSVQVVSTDPGYVVDSLSVYTLKSNGDREAISVNSNNCFVMPNKDVVVDVTLATVKTYDIATNYSYNGGYDLQVNGNSVNKAAAKTEVTVVAQPNSGYELYYIEVKQGSNDIKVSGNKFIMPAGDVSVSVTFISKSNSIKLEAIEGAELAAFKAQSMTKSNMISEAEEGQVVYIGAINVDTSAYKDVLKSVSVRSAFNGRTVAVTKAGSMYSFVMPRGGVEVSGEMESENAKVTVKIVADGNATGNTVNLSYNNETKNPQVDTLYDIPVSTKISLGTTPNTAYTFAGFTVYVGSTEDKVLTELANSENELTVPVGNVTLEAKFVAKTFTVPAAAINGPAGSTVSYQISTDNGATWVSGNKCIVNNKVKLVIETGDPNFTEKKVVVTDKAGNKVDVSADFTFVMPKDGIESVAVTFTGAEQQINFSTADGKNINMVQLNGTVFNDDTAKTVKVFSGSKVSFGLTAEGKKAYSIEKVEIVSGSTNYTATLNSSGNYEMTMPNVSDLKVILTLKPLPVEIKLSVTGSGKVEFFKDAGCVAKITDLKKVDLGDVYFAVTPNAEYRLKADSLKITKTASSEVVTEQAVGSVYKVEVPAGGLTVKAEFEKIPDSVELASKLSNGTVKFYSDKAMKAEDEITDKKADVAATVYFDVQPAAGYGLKADSVKLTSQDKDNKTADLTPTKTGTAYSFVVPANVKKITVKAEFESLTPTAELASDADKGSVAFYSDSAKTAASKITKAEIGSTVYFEVTANAGYSVNTTEVKDNKGNAVTVNSGSFVVPNDVEKVTVKATFTPDTINLDANTVKGAGTVFYLDAAKSANITEAKVGDTVYAMVTEYEKPLQAFKVNGTEQSCEDETTHSDRKDHWFKVTVPAGFSAEAIFG